MNAQGLGFWIFQIDTFPILVTYNVLSGKFYNLTLKLLSASEVPVCTHTQLGTFFLMDKE